MPRNFAGPSAAANEGLLWCAGIAKLDDANDAGTRHSQNCTLILTEGDSAKTMAVSGLSVVGRDRYGVFPLRRAPPAVRPSLRNLQERALCMTHSCWHRECFLASLANAQETLEQHPAMHKK